MLCMLRCNKLVALAVALAGLIVLAAARPAQAAFVIKAYDGTTLIGTSAVAETGPSNVLVASDANFLLSITVALTNNPGTPVLAALTVTNDSFVRVTASGTHTLTIDVTDTGFTMPTGSPLELASSAGGSFIGIGSGSSVSSTFQSWLDAGNMEFGGVNGGPAPAGPALTPGAGTAVQSAGASGGGALPLVYTPGTATNIANRGGSFSLSGRLTFTFTTGSGGEEADVGTSTMALPVAVPAPAGLALILSGLPVLGLGGLLRRRRNKA
jgi:hypothetical protein